MSDIIDYDDFMSNKNILHNEDINNHFNGLKYLIESKADIISYIKTDIYSTNNVDLFMRDNDNNYIVHVPIIRDCDIIDNIIVNSDCDIKVQLILGIDTYNYDDIKEIILASSSYNEIKIKLIFNKKPNMDDSINIKYRCYLINNDYRQVLLKNHINTKSNKYRNGCIYPYDNIK